MWRGYYKFLPSVNLARLKLYTVVSLSITVSKCCTKVENIAILGSCLFIFNDILGYKLEDISHFTISIESLIFCNLYTSLQPDVAHIKPFLS